MGLVERMQKENIEKGIVPTLFAQHSKYAVCENCGENIDPFNQGFQGRYLGEGEMLADGLDPEKDDALRYSHAECPRDAEELT